MVEFERVWAMGCYKSKKEEELAWSFTTSITCLMIGELSKDM